MTNMSSWSPVRSRSTPAVGRKRSLPSRRFHVVAVLVVLRRPGARPAVRNPRVSEEIAKKPGCVRGPGPISEGPYGPGPSCRPEQPERVGMRASPAKEGVAPWEARGPTEAIPLERKEVAMSRRERVASTPFGRFMASTAGRVVRGAIGIALIVAAPGWRCRRMGAWGLRGRPGRGRSVRLLRHHRADRQHLVGTRGPSTW